MTGITKKIWPRILLWRVKREDGTEFVYNPDFPGFWIDGQHQSDEHVKESFLEHLELQPGLICIKTIEEEFEVEVISRASVVVKGAELLKTGRAQGAALGVWFTVVLVLIIDIIK